MPNSPQRWHCWRVTGVKLSGGHDVRPTRVSGQEFFGQLDSFARNISGAQPATLAVAAAALVFLVLLRWRWRWPDIPGLLLALLATAAVAAFSLASHGVAVVGTIPAGFPVPQLPALLPGTLRPLALPAFTVLIVAFSDDVLTGRSFPRRGETIIANRELLALGIANAGAAPVRGFPVSSSATRSAIAVTTRSRTQVYSLVTAVTVIAVLLVARPVLARFPTAALGAIVIYAALRRLGPRYR
jgi:sulfate permease, SulP family